MRFYAYNPLAGGLLSGKYADYNRTLELGRFTLSVANKFPTAWEEFKTASPDYFKYFPTKQLNPD